MSRIYEELATGRRAVLVTFVRGVPGKRPARYVLAWCDTGQTFERDGPQVVREFAHVAETVKVEVGK